MKYENLKNKVVVITGASSGFGKGAARRFAQEGAALVLAARREPLLEELASECEAMGVRALMAPADVSIKEDVQAIAEQALVEFGIIHIWINNAGVGAFGPFLDIPLADHAQVLQTNLLGTLYGSYFALKQFTFQNEGTLINVASVLGKIPAPYYSSYTASKHGVVGLSGVFRQELSLMNQKNVHVCTILPTSMDTPFFEHAANYTGHEVKPIPPTYEPERVIETMVRLAKNPEDEVVVGTAGKAFAATYKIAPELVEKMMEKSTQRVVQEAEAAPDTSGAVQEPMEEGTEVTGGWKK